MVLLLLLLLNYSLIYFQLFDGVLCLSLFCYALLCVHHLEEEEKAGCFAIIVLQMYYMAFPHGAVGKSTVCDCGISWSYLLFLSIGSFLDLRISLPTTFLNVS